MYIRVAYKYDDIPHELVRPFLLSGSIMIPKIAWQFNIYTVSKQICTHHPKEFSYKEEYGKISPASLPGLHHLQYEIPSNSYCKWQTPWNPAMRLGPPSTYHLVKNYYIVGYSQKTSSLSFIPGILYVNEILFNTAFFFFSAEYCPMIKFQPNTSNTNKTWKVCFHFLEIKVCQLVYLWKTNRELACTLNSQHSCHIAVGSQLKALRTESSSISSTWHTMNI